jgi:hypothetical protein
MRSLCGFSSAAYRKFFAIFMLSIILNFLAAEGFAQTVQQPVQISIKQPSASFDVAKPVKIRILVKNVSQVPISYRDKQDSGLSSSMYRIDLYASDGSPVPRWSDGSVSATQPSSSSNTIITIGPGESLRQDVYLNAIFKIEAPGTYKVRVAFLDREHPVMSESITLDLISLMP